MSPSAQRRRLITLLSATPMVFVVPARASTKIPKSAVLYQDHPHGDQQCSGCRQYLSADSQSGQCAVVDGSIAATGWCLAFSLTS